LNRWGWVRSLCLVSIVGTDTGCDTGFDMTPAREGWSVRPSGMLIVGGSQLKLGIRLTGWYPSGFQTAVQWIYLRVSYCDDKRAEE